jgi:hypothetical protein
MDGFFSAVGGEQKPYVIRCYLKYQNDIKLL